MLLLLQDQERRDAQLAATEVLDALLGIACGLDDNVVECPDGSRDSDVVLLVNGSQIACE